MSLEVLGEAMAIQRRRLRLLEFRCISLNLPTDRRFVTPLDIEGWSMTRNPEPYEHSGDSLRQIGLRDISSWPWPAIETG